MLRNLAKECETLLAAEFVLKDDHVIGYVLYQIRTDDDYFDLPVVYLSQFLIDPQYRDEGDGKRAFNLGLRAEIIMGSRQQNAS